LTIAIVNIPEQRRPCVCYAVQVAKNCSSLSPFLFYLSATGPKTTHEINLNSSRKFNFEFSELKSDFDLMEETTSWCCSSQSSTCLSWNCSSDSTKSKSMLIPSLDRSLVPTYLLYFSHWDKASFIRGCDW